MEFSEVAKTLEVAADWHWLDAVQYGEAIQLCVFGC